MLRANVRFCSVRVYIYINCTIILLYRPILQLYIINTDTSLFLHYYTVVLFDVIILFCNHASGTIVLFYYYAILLFYYCITVL